MAARASCSTNGRRITSSSAVIRLLIFLTDLFNQIGRVILDDVLEPKRCRTADQKAPEYKASEAEKVKFFECALARAPLQPTRGCEFELQAQGKDLGFPR